MKKSVKSGMITKDTSEILNDLNGNDSLAVMYALRYCALNELTDNTVVSAIKALKTSGLVEWNTCSIADCAVAALDLLHIEAYTGDEPQILDMISTRFFSIEK